MNNFEQEFYQNFFTFRDEDKIKGIIYLTPFQETQLAPLTNEGNVPTTYIIKKGNKWADLLFTDSARLGLVVSERFRRIFEGYKGVNFTPIRILLKEPNIITGNYYNLIISGKCGGTIKDLSKEVLSTRIPGGPVFTERIGLYFDSNSWDNSDFFTPEGTLNTFITKKVKEVIEKNKLTNIMITPIIEEVNYKL